ncbi:putative F-box domain-containing protein [Helianthus annuus]|nr:putative F-box domain-containing protein [Helianthus annuus]
MSDHLPFEIQTEIMMRLPVKSLLRFRSFSKSCKSLIDSSDFIKHYIGQKQHLLVRCYDYVAHSEKQPMSIVDDHTFPTQRISVTLPEFVKYPDIIGSSHGLLCFYSLDNPTFGTTTGRAVIFNPCIRKTVAFAVPGVVYGPIYRTAIGFGVCCQTKDPKIVKITLVKSHIDFKSVDWIPWQVEVFTLSTRTWRSPYSNNVPSKSIIYMNQVVVDGCLYWLATDRLDQCDNLIISFDMTSEEFREVNLPDSLAHGYCSIYIYNLSESLAVVKDGVEDNKRVYDVWMMQDDSFIKLYTINSRHSPDVSIQRVCGFRKTGEPVVALETDPSSRILATYDPYSKSITNVGINGKLISYFVFSYMETLLLL